MRMLDLAWMSLLSLISWAQMMCLRYLRERIRVLEMRQRYGVREPMDLADLSSKEEGD